MPKKLTFLTRNTTARILSTSITGVMGATIALVFVALALSVWLSRNALLPYNPFAIDMTKAFQPPSWSHFFGTDSLGRDVFSRVLAATSIDALVAFVVVSVSLALGLLMGTIAAYEGGLIEEVLMRVTDIFLAFPGLVLALAIALDLGPNILNSMIALTPVWWPYYTRLARGETLNAKSQDFVEASKACGQRTRFILLHHIIPSILPVMLVYATMDIGNVLIIFSVLSFIGVGAQPPAAEWGLMVVQDSQYLFQAPWIVLFPSIAIFTVAMGFSMLGDKLRDSLDPAIRGLFT